jgi:hypothetical protein
MRLLASSRWLGLFAGFALMSIHAARETLSCHQLRQRHILRIYHSRRTMISYPLRGGELARFGPGSGNYIASIRTKCRTSSRSEVIPLTHCLVWPESDRNEQRDWFDGTTRLMGSMRPVSFQLGLRCSTSGSTKSATPKWKVHCRSLQRRFTSTRDVAPSIAQIAVVPMSAGNGSIRPKRKFQVYERIRDVRRKGDLADGYCVFIGDCALATAGLR